jgi:hypothetical protein
MAAINQDQFFSQLFQSGMSDPNSKVYLPQIIMGTTNPGLNPYTMDKLDLGSQNVGGVQLNILLTNIAIAGIPNVSVAPASGGSFTLKGLNAAIVAQFCKLSTPPPGVGTTLSLSSNFQLSFTGNQLTGTLTVLIDQATLNAQMIISGDQLENIVTTVTSINSAVPSTATISPTITFDGGGGGFWSQLFQNFLKKPSTITAIVGKINEQLNSQSVINSLSSELTTLFQNAIRQQLNPQT